MGNNLANLEFRVTPKSARVGIFAPFLSTNGMTGYMMIGVQVGRVFPDYVGL